MAAVDVLMPMRDAAPWVAAAWGSLARQTFRDWRLVAVDDGSRDGTADILEVAAAGDPRVTVIRQQARGVAPALNRGLREVSAPVVARMDADDVCHPLRLERLLALLASAPEVGVAGSRVRLFPRRLVSSAMGDYVAWQNGLLSPLEIRRERYVECTVTHASAAFRTAVLEEAGGWWEGEGPEDLDLFLRLHERGVVVSKSARYLYGWREREGRETRSSPRMTTAAFRAVKVRHLGGKLGGRAQTVHLFGRGASLADWGRHLRRAGFEVVECDLLPGVRPGSWEGLALFCFGHPAARQRVRNSLAHREEGTDYLFVA